MPDPSVPGKKLDSVPPQNQDGELLESWGEIANFLGRDARTVQRWERELGLPIHRVKTGKQGQVYAYRVELENWRKQRDEKPDTKTGSGDEAEEDVWWKWRGWKWVAGVIVLLGVGIVIGILLPPKQKPGATNKILLFVRPFESQGTADGEKEFVSGLTNELITQLGKVNPARLGVFAPTTSAELGNEPIHQLQHEIGTNYVLEGSVRRVKDEVRINVSLVSAEDQKTVWANSYTTDMKDVLKAQDEVSGDVVRRIQGTLPQGADVVASKRSLDPEAYEAYLSGRLYWLDRDIQRSRAAYEKALSKDPQFAPALAGLAMTMLLSGQSPNDLMHPKEAVPQARAAAKKALELDPTLGDAYCVLANIAQNYDYDRAEAERLYKKAVEVDPSNVTAHEWYGYYFLVLNKMPEAEKELKQALQLDPAAALLNTQAAEIQYYRRDFDVAIAQAERVLRDNPNFVYARIWRGCAMREKKMYPEALKEFALLRQQTNDSPASLALYGNALGLSGDKAGAMKVLQELEKAKQKRFVPAIYIAGVYLGIGDLPQVMVAMKQAYEERYDRLIYMNVEPMADALRGRADFGELMTEVGVR
jgi:TolB-like protein/Tfp pilus assembly protein PilF